MNEADRTCTSSSNPSYYSRVDYNVYCDETCHLEHDQSKAMALGAIWCPRPKVSEINQRIREIKKGYGISTNSEVKWTKASPGNLDLYLSLINFFFDSDDLCFRALVVPDKGKLDHDKYGQSHDLWYYKMYFEMLKTIFQPSSRYYIYIDIKDTHSGENARKLKEVCANDAYDFDYEIIKGVQPIRSDEVQLMQLVDILTGAMVYRLNNVGSDRQLSPAKTTIVDKIIDRSGCKLVKSTLPSARKFNLFVWTADWGN